MQLRSGKVINNNIDSYNFNIKSSVISKQSLILNLTTHEYFVARNKEFYINRMRELTTPPTKPLTKYDRSESHWRKTDKIVIVPKQLNDYVKRISAELFLEYDY